MRKLLAAFVVASAAALAWAGGGYISGQQGQPSQGGTGTSTVFTAGSVIFSGASGVYTQNNSQFFWDNTNNRLGIGTSAPNTALQLLSPTASRSILVNSPSPVLAATAGNTDAEIALFATQYSATAASMLDLLSYSTGSANPLFRISNHWESSGGASSSGTISIGTYVGSTFTDVLNITTGTSPGSATGTVGVMTSVPKSTFDVSGNMSVGTYGGVSAAPSNGLIVSGNVGIGTSNPTTLLDVNGISSMRGAFTVSVASLTVNGGTGNAGIIGIKAGAVKSWIISSQNNVSRALEITPSTADNGNSFTTPVILIQEGGNVGLGTTAPNALLDVRGGIGDFSRTIAQLAAITPAQVGIQYYCSDCSPSKIVVATGTSAANFADAAGGTFK